MAIPNLTVAEIDLLVEALAARAARLESQGRFRPAAAAPLDRKAAAMRKLRLRLLQTRARIPIFECKA